MHRILFTFCLVAALVSCEKTTSKTTETEPSTPVAKQIEIFGEAADFSTAIGYKLLKEKMAASPSDTIVTTVKAKVNDVCQVKGCWITIGEDDAMVKFKDYAFFMPKDISGREVIMHGQAYYQTTSIEELRHYAEDAGKSADEIAAITAPKKELRFLASGVQLLN